MFNINYFNLISSAENKEMYNCQCVILDEFIKNNSADSLIQIALLQTLSPIADYYESIKILYDYYKETGNIEVFIVGAYLSATWENYETNRFLNSVDDIICKANNIQKSMLYYLIAYDTFMHHEDICKNDKYNAVCKEALCKSISFSKRFVYSYYRLAMLSNRIEAKSLMREAFKHIEKVFDEKECKEIALFDLITFDSFVEEHILGINISSINRSELDEFYFSL